MPKILKITSLQCLFNILWKIWRMKLIFCLQINIKGFFKLILFFRCSWPGMPKLPKITSLLFLLYCLKKEVSDEVDFLHADKHQSYLQIDTMILMGMVKQSQSSQNSKFAMSLQYLKKKKLEIKLIFCMQINIKVFYKLISTLWT